ncbi:MAG: YbaB/EbfC family nucleoid-associated protein [Mycoplasmatota bacterium]
MNIQAMMKQAQKMQKDMMSAKEEINKTVFKEQTSFLTLEATGDRKVTSVKIDTDSLEKDDLEMLEDMILVTVNKLMDSIEKETEKKLGKYTQGMPGLF